MLSVRGLKKVYQTDGGDIEAVRNLTFDLRAGELACLVGPSGSGKTTLLKCISGLMAPTEGEVLLDGKRVSGPPKKMAVVFQEYGRSLFPWMRVRENVELPLKNQGVPKAERDRLVDEALEAVGLAHVPRSYPWQLSGGMQQRVAIARAIAYQPEVLLMDEPFAAVDAQTRADLEDLIRTIWKKFGVTVLFVTHDIDESVYLGERVIILSSSPDRGAGGHRDRPPGGPRPVGDPVAAPLHRAPPPRLRADPARQEGPPPARRSGSDATCKQNTPPRTIRGGVFRFSGRPNQPILLAASASESTAPSAQVGAQLGAEFGVNVGPVLDGAFLDVGGSSRRPRHR